MKKIIFYIFILIILIGAFSLTSVYAQDQGPVDSRYHLLAPINVPGGITDFAPWQENALGTYLNLMITIFIGLCAVLAVVMIVIGGIEYMTSELLASKAAGRERMTNAVLGLLIALGAYALLYTINPDILRTDLKSLTTATITVDLNDRVAQTAVNGRYSNGVAVNTPLTGTTTPLLPYVTLNASECAFVGQQNCTSTRGLNMSQVQAIQWGCGCPLVITGGTEWWLHGGKTGSTSHQSGNSTIDLRAGNPALDKYLSGGQKLVNQQRYSSPVGSVLYEGNHWHIGS